MIVRRDALATLSGAAAAGILLAIPTQRALAQAVAAGTKLAAGQYRPMTLQVGTLSKQMSVTALGKLGLHPRVAEFAKFEADEQTSIAQVLTDNNNPPPAPLKPEQQAKLTALQGLSGHAFETAYVAGQIEGHQELLSIQQGFLTGPVTDRDLEHIAVLARTTIVMHLTMLQDIQNALGA